MLVLRPAPVPSRLHRVPRGPLLQKHYTSFTALTTSCASPKSSRQLRCYTRRRVFAVWTTHCWSSGPSRRYAPRILPWMLGPLLRLPLRCSYPFLPSEHRPSPKRYWVGAQLKPVQRLPHGPLFRSCSHFLMFRPPGLLATQVVPTDASLDMAAVTFTSEHRPGCYLPARRIC